MYDDNRWFFMPGGAAPGTSLSKKDAETLIAKSTGIDLSYDVISADRWTASALLADRYGDRRIFIVGDAAHLQPPTAGYGMNMGIGISEERRVGTACVSTCRYRWSRDPEKKQ